MAKKLPPYPVAPPTIEKYVVWAIYRDVWYSIRSFGTIEEARDFAGKTLKGPTLITTQQTNHEHTAAELR